MENLFSDRIWIAAYILILAGLMSGPAQAGTAYTSFGTGSIYTVCNSTFAYIASGAGTTADNGTYKATSTSGGNTAYQNENGAWIYFYSTVWEMGPTKGAAPPQDYGGASTPDGTYMRQNGAVGTPTVVQGKSCIAGGTVTIK
jgi:hypothetical protein